MDWYIKVLKHYADFKGRAGRTEYWMFVLFNILIGFILGLIEILNGWYLFETEFGVLTSLYSLAVLIPGIAVSVRRLHDVGESGWMFLAYLLPIVGAIWLFILMIKDSKSEDNKYGQNPKNIFTKETIGNKFDPYVIAIVVFLAIIFIYFSPLLECKKLKQHDITMFKGMSKEIADFREKTGEEALWPNSMFGGMPAWQISVRYKANLIKYIDKTLMLGLPYPANYVFLYFLGFFILLLVLKIDPWVSLLGAIAFALSSYFFIILGAGHTSKAHAIGYMAPVLAGIILAFRGKLWYGALMFTLALALQIHAGHLQITYYLLMLVVIYGIYELIRAIQKKQLPYFAKEKNWTRQNQGKDCDVFESK